MRKLLFLICLVCSVGLAQVPYQIQFVTTDPIGACTVPAYPGYITLNRVTGNLMGCVNGSWVLIGGGGGPTNFGSILPGTNSSGTMVVGSGSALTTSGTGTINANRLMNVDLAGLTGLALLTAGIPSVAVPGTDYQLPVTVTAPIIKSVDDISISSTPNFASVTTGDGTTSGFQSYCQKISDGSNCVTWGIDSAGLTTAYQLNLPNTVPSGSSTYLTCSVPVSGVSTCYWSTGGSGGAGGGIQYFDAAGCNASVAFANLNLPSSNAPIAACISSGSVITGVLNFTAGTTQSAQRGFEIPSGYTTGNPITAEVCFQTSGADIGNTAALNLAFARVPTGSGITNPTFGTATVLSATASGTIVRQCVTNSAISLPTSSAAGDHLFWRIALDATNTLTSDYGLISVRFTMF